MPSMLTSAAIRWRTAPDDPLALGRAAGVAPPTLEALIPLTTFKAAAKGLYANEFSTLTGRAGNGRED